MCVCCHGAEDNWNDVLINTFSIISSIVAHFHKELWWFDPAGAMAISSLIMYNWVHVGLEHACKIVGLRYNTRTHIRTHIPLSTEGGRPRTHVILMYYAKRAAQGPHV